MMASWHERLFVEDFKKKKNSIQRHVYAVRICITMRITICDIKGFTIEEKRIALTLPWIIWFLHAYWVII